VERDRLREKERQARQQMQTQAEQRDLIQNMVEAEPLFVAPIRVSWTVPNTWMKKYIIWMEGIRV